MSFAIDIMRPENRPLYDQVVDALKKSSSSLFKTMFNSDIVFEDSVILDRLPDNYPVSGVMSIVQDEHEGLLVINLEKDLILQLISNFYGDEFEDFNDIVTQGIAEITNVMFGSFKRETEKIGYSFQMFIPSVVSGPQHLENISIYRDKIISLNCKIDNKNLTINLFLNKKFI